jgi:hypothetical protein
MTWSRHLAAIEAVIPPSGYFNGYGVGLLTAAKLRQEVIEALALRLSRDDGFGEVRRFICIGCKRDADVVVCYLDYTTASGMERSLVLRCKRAPLGYTLDEMRAMCLGEDPDRLDKLTREQHGATRHPLNG